MSVRCNVSKYIKAERPAAPEEGKTSSGIDRFELTGSSTLDERSMDGNKGLKRRKRFCWKGGSKESRRSEKLAVLVVAVVVVVVVVVVENGWP